MYPERMNASTGKIACTCLLIALAMMVPTRAWACLSASADQRAVQWSTLIVRATLKDISPAQAVDATAASTRPAVVFHIYHLNVTDVFDGNSKPGATIAVVRFFRSGAGISACSLHWNADSVGKSYVLLLRPLGSLHLDGDASVVQDHGAVTLTDAENLAVVYGLDAADFTSDAADDLKHTIADVRAAEARLTTDDARTQALTLAGAVDDTEAAAAEHTLLDMGYKALPTIVTVRDSCDQAGRIRLGPVIHDLSLPALAPTDPDQE